MPFVWSFAVSLICLGFGAKALLKKARDALKQIIKFPSAAAGWHQFLLPQVGVFLRASQLLALASRLHEDKSSQMAAASAMGEATQWSLLSAAQFLDVVHVAYLAPQTTGAFLFAFCRFY